RKLFFFFVATLLLACSQLYAQNDTVKVEDDLLNSLLSDSANKQKLLPDRMMFTQRLLWGKQGLMRKFTAYELTPEERTRELKIRRTMLICHQVLGGITSLGMIGQGIVGSKLYNGDNSIKDMHGALAAGINITYFSTAAMALFAPPKMLNERKGYSSIKIHKWLAVIHLTSMLATNILADQIEENRNPQLRKWHKTAAYTLFGSFLAAQIVIEI
ncbi:MAG: hypothetical protein AABZ32_03970, partial [Bacteroidota bacterium]